MTSIEDQIKFLETPIRELRIDVPPFGVRRAFRDITWSHSLLAQMERAGIKTPNDLMVLRRSDLLHKGFDRNDVDRITSQLQRFDLPLPQKTVQWEDRNRLNHLKGQLSRQSAVTDPQPHTNGAAVPAVDAPATVTPDPIDGLTGKEWALANRIFNDLIEFPSDRRKLIVERALEDAARNDREEENQKAELLEQFKDLSTEQLKALLGSVQPKG